MIVLKTGARFKTTNEHHRLRRAFLSITSMFMNFSGCEAQVKWLPGLVRSGKGEKSLPWERGRASGCLKDGWQKVLEHKP